jgi:tRNA (guanine10-N2)-dimethyltransferase
MKLLFELTKEHKTLPTDEVLSCLKAEGIVYHVIESNENALVIKSDVDYEKISGIAKRLSLIFYVDELLFSCSNSIDEIKKCAVENNIDRMGSISIKYRNRSNSINSQQIVRTLADAYTKNRIVNLRNPDLEVRVLITDRKTYVGLKIAEVERSQFDKRKVQYRPFFSPISLHPKLARVLVNLSCIKKNETLLDPFCGTGGILLEAGLIDAKVVGSDIEEKMIDGCRKTLDFYKIKNYDLFCSDVGDIHKYVTDVDAIVTDLPYGKSTTTKGENLHQLYNRAFDSISNVLKKEKIAVVGLSNKDMISVGEKYFSLIKKHEFRVHGSLTRYFAVYLK